MANFKNAFSRTKCLNDGNFLEKNAWSMVAKDKTKIS